MPVARLARRLPPGSLWSVGGPQPRWGRRRRPGLRQLPPAGEVRRRRSRDPVVADRKEERAPCPDGSGARGLCCAASGAGPAPALAALFTAGRGRDGREGSVWPGGPARRRRGGTSRADTEQGSAVLRAFGAARPAPTWDPDLLPRADGASPGPLRGPRPVSSAFFRPFFPGRGPTRACPAFSASQPAAPGAPGVGAVLAQPRGPSVKRRPPPGSSRPTPAPVRPAPAAPRGSGAAQPPGSHRRRGWRGWERARPAGNGGTERRGWHGAGLCSRPRPAWGCPGAPAEKRASRLLVRRAARASSDAPGRPCRPQRSWPAPPCGWNLGDLSSKVGDVCERPSLSVQRLADGVALRCFQDQVWLLQFLQPQIGVLVCL